MTIKENRPGQLKTDKDFLRALQGLVADFNTLVRAFNALVDTPMTFAEIIETPTTLSGYGIVDAAPIQHRHNWSDIDGAPAPGSGVIVAWSSITGKPFTVDGFGIVDASKIGHKHAWADILDPPPPGSGPPGLDGDDGAPGARGSKGDTIVGLDGLPGPEAMMIPGLSGKKGDRGPVTPPIIWFEQGPPLEPLIVPGGKGAPGVAGAGGVPGRMGFIPPELPQPPLEPLMIQGKPGAAGIAGRIMMIPGLDGKPAPEPMMIPGKQGEEGFGFTAAGEWRAAFNYFPLDVVGYQGTLWWTKFGHPPGDVPGLTADWLEMLTMPKPRPGPPGWEVAPPIEPLMIPGRKGDTGGSGGGGLTLTTVELDIGAAPRLRRSGHLQITGLAGLTVGKPVLVQQAAGPYTGKGSRADEAEMDMLRTTGKVFSATTIDVYWESQRRVRGKFKFDYAVSA